VFYRAIEGTEYRFEVRGLWGSGNTISERSLTWIGAETVYNMWSGKGLVGPRAGQYIDKYPALWGTMGLAEFRDRHREIAGVDCQYWAGEELLGFDCEAACGNLGDVCGDASMETHCLTMCGNLPRHATDCLQGLSACEGWQTLCRMGG
jgi:hypothetical protein